MVGTMERPVELIGLAYTGDVDQSVAQCDQLPGFGCFEIPIAGSLTAIVGRNGSGKTRFLRSIGIQTELMYRLDPPLGRELGVASTDGRPYAGHILRSPLWGLVEGADRDGWLVPRIDADGVAGIWPEPPLTRFETLRDLNSPKQDWSRNLNPGESLHRPLDGKFDFPTSNGTAFGERLWESAALSQATQEEWLAELTPYAATAMYVFYGQAENSSAVDWHWREQLYMLAVGREIARQRVISLTGAARSTGQRLRFWFEADPISTPASTLLLIGTSPWLRRDRYRADLAPVIWDPEVEEDPTYCQPRFVEDTFSSVVYANGDAGLVTHPGSPRHFTPLLPLELLSAATVLNADDDRPLFLDHDSVLALAGQTPPHLTSYPDEPATWCGDGQLRQTITEFESDVAEAEGKQIVLGLARERRRLAFAEQWRASMIVGQGEAKSIELSVPDEEVRFLDVFVRVVNRIAQLLLERPPFAFIDISSGSVEWRFVKHGPLPDSPRETLAHSDLSLGERRWTSFANLLAERFLLRAVRAFGEPSDTEWATSILGERPSGDPFGHTRTVITIDEPESGLHPTAVRHLAQGLDQLGEALQVHFVVATHSPNVLRVVRSANGTIAHASINSSGETIFEAVNPSEIEELASVIGMHQEDLLQMTSTFVIVEGEHDKVVIDGVLSDSLSRAGAVIVPMRGADGSHQIVDSAILWRFHEGRIIVVLDSLNTPRITSTLEVAKQLVRSGETEDALSVIAKLQSGSTDEGTRELQALHELLVHAVRARRLERLEVFSLSKPDIIDYFHPSELGTLPDNSEFEATPAEVVWPELLKRHRNAPKKNKPGFKTWALRELGIEGDVTRVLCQAALRLDRVPSDFDDLSRLLLNRP